MAIDAAEADVVRESYRLHTLGKLVADTRIRTPAERCRTSRARNWRSQIRRRVRLPVLRECSLLTCLQTYLLAIMYHCIVGATGFQNFFPSLTETLGYSRVVTLLLGMWITSSRCAPRANTSISGPPISIHHVSEIRVDLPRTPLIFHSLLQGMGARAFRMLTSVPSSVFGH